MKTYPYDPRGVNPHPSKMMTFNPKNTSGRTLIMCNYSYSSFRPVDTGKIPPAARFFTGVVDAGSTINEMNSAMNRYYATFLDYAINYSGLNRAFSSDTEVRLTYANLNTMPTNDLTKLITDPSTPIYHGVGGLQSTGESWTEDLSTRLRPDYIKTINFELTLTATTKTLKYTFFSHARTADGISFVGTINIDSGLNGVTGSGHDWTALNPSVRGVSTYAGIAVNYGRAAQVVMFMHRISVLVARTAGRITTPGTATADSVLETVIGCCHHSATVHNTFPMFQNNGITATWTPFPAADKWTFKTTSLSVTDYRFADWRYAQASSYTPMLKADYDTYGTGGPVWSTGAPGTKRIEHIEDDNAHIRRGMTQAEFGFVVFVEIRNVTRLGEFRELGENTAETETMTKIGSIITSETGFGVYVDAAGDAGKYIIYENPVPLSTFNLAELFPATHEDADYTDWMVTIKANDYFVGREYNSINIIRYGLPGTDIIENGITRQADAITEIEKVAKTVDSGAVQFGTAVDDATLALDGGEVIHTHTSAAFGIKRATTTEFGFVQLPISPLQQAELDKYAVVGSSIYIDKTNFGLSNVQNVPDQQFTGKLVAVKSYINDMPLTTEFGDREDLAATPALIKKLDCTFVPPESDDLGLMAVRLLAGTSTATVTINGNGIQSVPFIPTTVGPYLPGNESGGDGLFYQLILYPDSRGLEFNGKKLLERDSQTVNAGNNPITWQSGANESEGVGAQFTVDPRVIRFIGNGTFGMKPGLTSITSAVGTEPKLSTLANKLLRLPAAAQSIATLVYGKTQPQLTDYVNNLFPHRDSWGAIRALENNGIASEIVDKLYRDAPAHAHVPRKDKGAPAPDVNNDVYQLLVKYHQGVNLNWWAGENDYVQIRSLPSEFAPGYQKTDVAKWLKFKSITVKTSKQTVNYSFNVDNPPELAGEVEFSVVRREGNGVYEAIGSGSSNYSYTLTTGLTDTGASILRLQLKQRAIYLTLTTPETTLNPGELIDWMLCYANGQNTTFDAYSLAVKYRLPSIPYDGTGGYTYNASRRRYSLSYTLDLQYRAGVTLITSEQYATVAVGAKLGEAISRVDPIARKVDIKFDWENWRGESELMEAIDRYPVDCQWDNVIGDLYFPPAIGIGEATAEMIAAEREANNHGGVWITNPKYQSGFTLDYHDDYVITHAYVTGMARTGHVCAPFYTTSLVVKSGGKKLTLGQTGEAVTPIGTKYRMLFPAQEKECKMAVVPDPHYQEPGNIVVTGCFL
ncbi:hypothetical protein SPFM12_00110 [Salmonella phage SPFM12]|nr:hypothetical protein SPFM12_00110 [Salmonella phage SPFM12]